MSAQDNIALGTVGVTFLGVVTVTWIIVTRRDNLQLIKVKAVSLCGRLVHGAIVMQIRQRRRRESEWGGRQHSWLLL